MDPLFRKIKQKETQFLKGKLIETQLLNAQYIPSECHHFAEFAFLLKRLKSMMLIHFPEIPEFNDVYIQIWKNILVDFPDMELYKIQHDIETETMNLKYSYIIYHTQDKEALMKILHKPRITDQELGILLDYPGTLPISNEDCIRNGFIQVVYYQVEEHQPTCLATVYGCRPNEHPYVISHFKRYQEAIRPFFNISIKID